MDVYRMRIRLGHVGKDNADGVRVFGGREGVVITIDPTKAKTVDIETRLRREALDMLQVIRERLEDKT
jgi:limonene-1,2-epoxide hydrolase